MSNDVIIHVCNGRHHGPHCGAPESGHSAYPGAFFDESVKGPRCPDCALIAGWHLSQELAAMRDPKKGPYVPRLKWKRPR